MPPSACCAVCAYVRQRTVHHNAVQLVVRVPGIGLHRLKPIRLVRRDLSVNDGRDALEPGCREDAGYVDHAVMGEPQNLRSREIPHGFFRRSENICCVHCVRRGQVLAQISYTASAVFHPPGCSTQRTITDHSYDVAKPI